MDGQGSRSPAYDHVDSFIAKAHGHAPEGAVVIADPNLIFNGEFKRTGLDLVLSHDGHEFVVHDYFRGDKRAAIASPDGAHLTGDIVSALTGYVQYAQAAPGAAAAQVIGHVTKLTGSATAIRNGVSVILNNGDNVEKGDVVATGSDSTLGVTFIDGTVFGLSSNARMVLNEMVYDPNGSNNSSLLSLVAGTITFVAGETAKHGDMKIDTPVATMGIRGTAVLTEINFVVPSGGGDPQPQANFQVLVEPNGTTGSYILFDKLTLLPIATVNQAGQMIQISGGNVSVTNALLSPDVQKLITDVFTLKFTDNNTNTKLTTNFTDTITQDGNNVLIKTASGATAQATFTNTGNNNGNGQTQGGADKTAERFPGPPQARTLDLNGNVTAAFKLTEHASTTGDHSDTTGDTVGPDTVSGRITFVDQNIGDRPTVSVNLAQAPNFVYQNAGQQDVTGSLTALQKQDIAATQIQISVVPDGANTNNGSALWTYTIPDHVFDFLAAGETLTLTYTVLVNDNFAVNPESFPITITITIMGTNDKPVITTSVPTITFAGGTSIPGGPLTTEVPTSGTLTFTDVDLTDTHTVSVSKFSAVLPGGTVPKAISDLLAGALLVSITSGHDSTGTGAGSINWSLKDIPVYLADFIPKGEVLTLTYTVTVKDSQGATSDQTVTVTITGTDAPAVVWIATNTPLGGFWKDGANWETGAVPTSSDDVIVITDQLHGLTPSYPVMIDAAAFGRSLIMDDYDTTLHHTAPEVINHSTLTIAGTLTLNADAKFTNAADGDVLVGGAIDVETITRKTGEVVTNTSTITNAGALKLAAGGVIDTLTTIANSGTIELSGGTLALKTSIANAGGTVQVDAGAALVADAVTVDGGTVAIFGTLEIAGAATLLNDVVTNKGTVTVDDGKTLTLSGTEITGGTINNYSGASGGAIDVAGDSTIDGNATLNKGAVTVESDVTLTLGDATVAGTAITNHGTVKVNDSKKLSLNGASLTGGTLTVSGTLDSTGTTTITNTNISNTYLIEAIGGVLALVATTSTTAITNGGTLQANGAELDINGEAVTNTRTLAAINDGTLKLISNIVTNTGGAVSIESGSTLDLSSATVKGGTLAIAGTLESIGTSAITDADVTNTGTISVISGTLTIDPTVLHSLTNHKLIQANGGELDISGEQIVNTADIKAIGGGILKLSTLSVTNDGGTVTVDGTSKLYLTGVSINGGSLNNFGNLYGVSGSNTISAGVTNTGTIEVQAGTLNLSGGLAGAGSLVIDNGATLELAGATAQTVTFAGGTDKLLLDKVAGQSFTGTIAGRSSTGGAFTITGAADITTSGGDALDFTASGGSLATPADIFLTPTGALTGAAKGVVVTQNGVGNISLTATKDITGLGGNGITLRDSATGFGNITVNNLTGKATGTGVNSEGILVENLNAANGGDISITQRGDAVGGAYGIDATTLGDGDVTIDAGGNVTGSSIYGIRARSHGTGNETVTTEVGSVVTSGSSGIIAVNYATSIRSGLDSTITVEAHGTIHSGSTLNNDGGTPGGIIAGYRPGGNATFSGAVNGDVTVDSDAKITADAGYGIEAFTWGVGDVTVTTGALSSITAAGTAIGAFDHGGGNVSVTNEGSAAGAVGLSALAVGAGNVTIVNGGDITSTSLAGISVTQNEDGAIGSTHITNTASIVAPSAQAAIYIQENTTGSALIDNSGTIGPAAANVTATTYAIVETGGAITINNSGHINGNISVGTATFNNKAGGTWTVAGSGVFGNASSIVNHGAIDLHGASISGTGLSIENDNDIDSWGTASISGTIANAGTIEVHDGHLTLFGSLSGSGSVTVDAGAFLKVEDTVSQTIALAGDGAHLQIDTQTFGGSIAALSATDTIDLSSIDYGLGTSAVYVANADASTGGTLTISDAYGHHISLVLTGADYSNATFAGSNDGAGHTLITVKAADDAPKFTMDNATLTASFSELADHTNSPTLDPAPAATGSIAFTDIDLTDRPTATITHQDVTWLDSNHSPLTLTPDEISALETALSLQQTGKNNGTVGWSYSIADGALDFLGQDQTVKVVSTITLNDGHKTDTTQVIVTVTGANDAPTLVDVTTGPLVDTAATDSFPGPIGKLVGTDADSGETATLTYSVLNADSHGTATGHYGSLTVNANGTYDYVPDATAINALSAGSYVDSFTVQTTDAHGAIGTATFTVNVTGANDTPVLSNGSLGKLTDTAATDGFANLTGQLAGTDADTGETATLHYAVLDGHGQATSTVTGHYGSLTISASGSYTYVPDAASINALPQGSYSDAFTVQLRDVHGAVTTATYTVGVTGADDAPVLNIDNISVTQQDDEKIVVHGLKITDADAAAGETFTLHASTAASGSNVSPSSGSGSLASINAMLGTVTYNEGSGEPATDKVTLTVADGHGATDTLNLIFNLREEGQPGNVALTGTTGKDVFFGTVGHDQFVFAANSNHDTIVNFTSGEDRIDLRAVVTTSNISDWMAHHVSVSPASSADTLITIDAADTIVLKGVTHLSASDILHA